MEKRIKTVWILTIITAILIIGGQGYWLHHQYCYSTRTFMQELHKQILQLEKEEMTAKQPVSLVFIDKKVKLIIWIH